MSNTVKRGIAITRHIGSGYSVRFPRAIKYESVASAYDEDGNLVRCDGEVVAWSSFIFG